MTPHRKAHWITVAVVAAIFGAGLATACGAAYALFAVARWAISGGHS